MVGSFTVHPPASFVDRGPVHSHSADGPLDAAFLVRDMLRRLRRKHRPVPVAEMPADPFPLSWTPAVMRVRLMEIELGADHRSGPALWSSWKSDKAKFESQFTRSDDKDCWNWQGRKRALGYGEFQYRGRNITASRASLMFAHRIVDHEKVAGLLALHKCCNPSCVNPNHLYWGSSWDNHVDTVNDGNFFHRKPRAEKFSDTLIEELVQRITTGAIW